MNKLKFNKKKHKYTYKNEDLISVTNFISMFFEEFKAKEIARKLSKFKVNKENKRGVRYWLGKWKTSRDHGNIIHKAMEDYIDGIDNECTHPHAVFGRKYINLLKKEGYSSFDSEVMVYHDKHKLAGTIDLVAESDTGCVLIDWKTNKEIKTKAYKGRSGLPPLTDIDDCNYSKYVLQLSIYAFLYEYNTGKKVKELRLVHLTDKGAVEYIIPRRGDLVRRLLNIRKLEVKNESRRIERQKNNVDTNSN